MERPLRDRFGSRVGNISIPHEKIVFYFSDTMGTVFAEFLKTVTLLKMVVPSPSVPPTRIRGNDPIPQIQHHRKHTGIVRYDHSFGFIHFSPESERFGCVFEPISKPETNGNKWKHYG